MGWNTESGYFECAAGNSRLRLQFETENTVRVTCTRNPEFSKEPSLMIDPARPRLRIEPVIEESQNAIRLRTAAMELQVDRVSGAIRYLNAEGKLLLQENPGQPRELQPEELIEHIADASSAERIQTADGERVIPARYERVKVRDAWRGGLRFQPGPGEALYGLGMHEEGRLNLRASVQYLYQHNLKVALPVIVSTNGYSLFFDHSCAMVFRDDDSGSAMELEVFDDLDYYVSTGPSFPDLLAEHRRLTGRAVLPPRYAFGYVQCRERYRSETELLETVREFRRRGIPLDLIVQDWQYWPEGMWGEKVFDPERFPEPAGMVEDLHSMEARLMISLWPVCRGGPNEKELVETGLGLNGSNIYDAFRREGRELYWKHTLELAEYGLDAWWTDSTEPVVADWHDERRLSDPERGRRNIRTLAESTGALRLNAYSLYHAMGLYEGMRDFAPGKRVLNLTRSHSPGQQRFGTVTWTGDTCANWDSLRNDLIAGLGFSAAGGPFWSFDAGGFFVRPRVAGEEHRWHRERAAFPDGVRDPAYAELYVRWLQLAAFCPMMRSHGTDFPREPWQFAPSGNRFYEAVLDVIRLRYRFFPYIYSIAATVHHEDRVMTVPMGLAFGNDPECRNIGDQFMLGPDLMVCPIVEPDNGGEAQRTVCLPAGTTWFDFWTGARHEGGRRIPIAASLETVPLFVRSGAILPLAIETGARSSASLGADLELRTFPGGESTFTLYEDAGDGWGYANGEFSRIRFSVVEAGRSVIIGDRMGSFTGMPETRKFTVNGTPVAYVGKETRISLSP